MNSSPSVADKRQKQERACTAAENFAKLFYETLDRKRHLISNFYMENAHVVWNGNSYSGKEDITKFYQSLPESMSELRTVDAQPILDSIVEEQTSILVSVAGNIRYSGKSHLFSESFLLTAQPAAQPGAQGNVWKVVSDCMRFHEP